MHRANSRKPCKLMTGHCDPFIRWTIDQVCKEHWSPLAFAGYAKAKGLYSPHDMMGRSITGLLKPLNNCTRCIVINSVRSLRPLQLTTAQNLRIFPASSNGGPRFTSLIPAAHGSMKSILIEKYYQLKSYSTCTCNLGHFNFASTESCH